MRVSKKANRLFAIDNGIVFTPVCRFIFICFIAQLCQRDRDLNGYCLPLGWFCHSENSVDTFHIIYKSKHKSTKSFSLIERYNIKKPNQKLN